MYNKYGAHKSICCQGHKHDSKKEAERCNELHLLLRAGVITNLEVQKRFCLIPPRKYNRMPNERGWDYIADFAYNENGKLIEENASLRQQIQTLADENKKLRETIFRTTTDNFEYE